MFYINVPFGILAVLGMLAFIPDTPHAARARFDFFGFATLSLGIGALQLMLDRGQPQDWFGSARDQDRGGDRRRWRCYLFVVHTLTARAARSSSLALFKDRNFFTGNCLHLHRRRRAVRDDGAAAADSCRT